jgi:multicomponent Na+:H+ antiporter subunit D
VLFVLAGVGLVGLPPFGTFVGKGLIEESAIAMHYGWVVIVFVLASALSGAAWLRAAARVFLGWEGGGPGAAETEDVDHGETAEARTRTPAVMLAPIVALVAVGLGVGLVPGLVHHAQDAAARFVDARAYAAEVIEGARVAAAGPAQESVGTPPVAAVAGVVTGLLTLGIALAVLQRRRLPAKLVTGLRSLGDPVLGSLRSLHSGHIGDYIAWLTVGVATFGGILAAVVR